MKNDDLIKFMMSGDQPMIIGKVEPLNRSDRRKMDREFDAVIKHLVSTEERFLNQLFDEENGLGYADLYNFYNSQYHNNCAHMNSVIKPKYFSANEMYFVDMYKPVI
tara:strand:- start:6875 stop:7195 length:321 start_codon:yes stop_codon:yes gene_type:complete